MERLASSLKKNLENAEKAMSLSRLMVTRQQEALDEQVAQEPKLSLIREKTQQLKKQVKCGGSIGPCGSLIQRQGPMFVPLVTIETH